MVRNYRASRARRNVPSRNVNNCTSKNMNRDEAGGWERTRDAKAVGRRRLGEGDRAKNRRAGRARRSGALQAQKCVKLNYMPESKGSKG